LSSRLSRFDRRLSRSTGARRLAGVDEVGRGCLAGPVVVAAVILPCGLEIPGVNDSKRLSASARARAFVRILQNCEQWSATAVSAAEVDQHNVLMASLLGMERAIRRLDPAPDLIMIDGNRLPLNAPPSAIALVKGDGRSLCVAAASIVAKVLRDRIMRSWHRRYPAYGFDRHVGYPTPQHRRALIAEGPCPLHRRSFAPVRATLKERLRGTS